MLVDEFRKHIEGRGLNSEVIALSISAVKEFEEYLGKRKATIHSASLDTLKEYVSSLVVAGNNSLERLVALARYCNFARKNDYYVYLVSLFGARNVLPDIGERLEEIAGGEARKKVFEGFELPPLGSPQDAYPRLTKMVTDRMESELPVETCRRVLTWNYHNVPVESFRENKERFEKANNIDDYLHDEHERFVKELEQHMKEGRIWFEQEITPEVLLFVKSNQEICTGVRRGDRIYVTKMPYAPKQYLEENDPRMKRYYACHCQLARTAIRDDEPKISRDFCYCSAGFEKLRFEAIFGEPVEVEVLETALDGDVRCRFANKIPEGR